MYPKTLLRDEDTAILVAYLSPPFVKQAGSSPSLHRADVEGTGLGLAIPRQFNLRESRDMKMEYQKRSAHEKIG